MKIGIISDVHGNYIALKTVVDDMKDEGIDGVVVLGDVIFFGDSPQECFDTIRSLKPLAWIKGNTDGYFTEIGDGFKASNDIEAMIGSEFLSVKGRISSELEEHMKGLPDKKEIEIEGLKILCVHGSDRRINEPIGVGASSDELDNLVERLEADILLCGHTHIPYVVRHRGKLIMNVGSVGAPKNNRGASYGVIEVNSSSFSYGIRELSI